MAQSSDYAHILVDEPRLDMILEAEMPTEGYYRLLAEDMRRRHPRASKLVPEHLASTEAMLDVGIVSGFSFWHQ